VRHKVFGLHAEYLPGPWSLRAEYVWHPEEDGPDLRAFYVEAARRLGTHWEAAARYDWSDTVLSSGQALRARALGRQEDAALGLNYWFSNGFKLKLSYHHVNGNRFARPDELEEVLDAGALEARTDLVLIGAQFSF
jgi:phosphate-selective porin